MLLQITTKYRFILKEKLFYLVILELWDSPVFSVVKGN